MNYDLYKKKQIVFPDLFSRMMTLLFDLTFLAFLMKIPTEQITYYLFKLNFANFITANNLVINSVKDIQLSFLKENLTSFPSLNETLIFWAEFLCTQYLLLSLYFIFCWHKFGTTFGKYIFKTKISDYETGKNPKLTSCIIRYISYVFIPISIFMVVFGKERRGLHDVFAGTIVIKK